MVKIKHRAYTTTDPDKVAAFYVETLGMKEVGRGSGGHVYLSDGELNMTIRKCKAGDDADVGEQGANFSGLHHIGFVVDNVEESAEKMEKAGAKKMQMVAGDKDFKETHRDLKEDPVWVSMAEPEAGQVG